ncbi:MAG: DNA repair protein RecN, partial [Alphaproteobacteria bacterium]|nr:DNA repair protein RecN [Alphaproteobacteria bacterium]
EIVLIDGVDLDLRPGLCVFTGETGAGKSILLDALGLALGGRGGGGLLRQGAAQGSVVAEFDIPVSHPARMLLEQQGLTDGPDLVLRRQISPDGRGRAFINDQPVSIGLLRQLGETLVEVHGQHDERGLLNAAGHRALLDAYGGLQDQLAACQEAYETMRRTERAAEAARAELAAAREEEDYLRHVHGELETLDPRPGDEDELAKTRTLLRQGEKIADALREAASALHDGDGIEGRLRIAQRTLERVAADAGGALDGAIDGLDRAAVEAIEAIATVQDAGDALDLDPARLEEVEGRLFALREAARKHRVTVDQLPALRADMARRLETIDGGGQHLAGLLAAADAAREDFLAAAGALSQARSKAAKRLDRAVTGELRPLALDKAVFRTELTSREEAAWNGDGIDRVAFLIATNPGTEPAPLQKIASGGELSRIMLALKVSLAQNREPASLIFDEVDRGVGGAVADKVGERLAKLAAATQVIVVTHSPQVAARADHHWRIVKLADDGVSRTAVQPLNGKQRREEIARMLAGATVTTEARAAAASLLQEGRA